MPNRRLARLRAIILVLPLLSLALGAGGAAAQALEGTGLLATGMLLRRMDGVKSVLMIGAHPDDEDTSLLAALARRYGARTAYLSLTRGEGGQNLIGPELWEGLGVIRTGELEAARSLDGGEQFFTRALDYGFSKRADEALTFWPREELLADVVWIIRRFRPQVVIAVFQGTPADGHGQHQASGIIAREAFAAAGDPARFPEQLELGVEPWAPLKLFDLSRRRPEEATATVPTGSYDPLLGRSDLQLSMESRSFHRSQDMGAPRPPGPRTSGVRLEADRTGAGDATGIFAGIDTTLVGIVGELPNGAAGPVRTHLEAYRASLEDARARFGGLDPFDIAQPLVETVAHLSAAREAAGAEADAQVAGVLDRKLGLARDALLSAAGVTLDVRAADDLIIPGQNVRVSALAWNGGPLVLRATRVALSLPEGWSSELVGAEGLEPDGTIAPGALATWTFEVAVPPDAELSRLYYLRSPREGWLYTWPADEPEVWGLPRDPAPVAARFALTVQSRSGGVSLEEERPWSFVGVDPARGEFRRPVLTVPALSATVSPGSMAWPQTHREPRTLTVAVRSETAGASRGRVVLQAPEGWLVTPEGYDLAVEGEGAARSYAFEIRPADGIEPGTATFRAVVSTGDGRRYGEGFTIVDYEHIERAALFEPAEASVSVIPVRLTDGLRVGYVMGTGDAGPEALRQMGADVTLLGPDDVRAGAYGVFDAVVVGVRAYETREDLRAANAQLLEYARDGGTVVVQYNQYDFPRDGYAPFPIGMSRPAQRVAEEDAEVRVLEPRAPVFTTPNRIGAADFEGWVQERGLYFLGEWDERYTPLLEMHDRGEEPARGSLLVAPVGEGVWVYAALSFFRQWPSGVPGAYRLFANLVSLDGEAWRAFLAARPR